MEKMNDIKRAVASLLSTAMLFTLALFSSALAAAPDKELWSVWDAADEASTSVIDHSAWQTVLDNYLVTDHPSGVNRFDYQGVTEQHAELLDDYLADLQGLDPRTYNRAEQQAYWINFYNALTVQVILAEYPVKSILRTGSSFFQGPWDDKLVEVSGYELTLNDIEHRILRPIWDDDRLHFAVNCASIGCPALQPVPFTAENTEELLESSAKEFISHPRGVEFKGDRLVLSKIFKWYQVDFGDDTAEMLQTISDYAEPALAEKLQNYQRKPKYQYDWGLNKP